MNGVMLALLLPAAVGALWLAVDVLIARAARWQARRTIEAEWDDAVRRAVCRPVLFPADLEREREQARHIALKWRNRT